MAFTSRSVELTDVLERFRRRVPATNRFAMGGIIVESLVATRKGVPPFLDAFRRGSYGSFEESEAPFRREPIRSPSLHGVVRFFDGEFVARFSTVFPNHFRGFSPSFVTSVEKLHSSHTIRTVRNVLLGAIIRSSRVIRPAGRVSSGATARFRLLWVWYLRSSVSDRDTFHCSAFRTAATGERGTFRDRTGVRLERLRHRRGETHKLNRCSV